VILLASLSAFLMVSPLAGLYLSLLIPISFPPVVVYTMVVTNGVRGSGAARRLPASARTIPPHMPDDAQGCCTGARAHTLMHTCIAVCWNLPSCNPHLLLAW